MIDAAAAGQIHEASLKLLEDPGVRFEHDGVCERLILAGAQAGAAAQVLRLPRGLVAECLAAAPKQVHLADRRSEGRTLSATSAPRVWSTPGMNFVRRGACRLFTSTDMAEYSRLLDRLPHCDGVFGMSMNDVPPPARDAVGLRIMAENTTKHVRAVCFSPAGADALRRMKDVAEGAWFSIGFTAHGPLRWTNLALEIFTRTAGAGIPTTINGEPMAGTSGPVTLAGSAAVGNAEILAGLVVNQLLEPGRGCIYNLGLAHVFDMRTAIAVTGAPENHLFAQISSAMGRFYNLPSCSWVSTESMVPDVQAAMEKSIGYCTHMAAGVSLVWGIGQLESELAACPAQAVIDDEIIAYVRRLLRGVEVSDAALAVDVTRQVGVAGSFLAHDHTLENFRGEFFEPAISLRRKRQSWEAAGSKPLDEVAEDKVDALLAGERQPCLSDSQSKELRRIEAKFLKGL